MKPETKKERQERKDMYLLQVMRSSRGVEDIDALLEEAGNNWEEKNK